VAKSRRPDRHFDKGIGYLFVRPSGESYICIKSNHPSNSCPQYIYALGGGELLILNDYQNLVKTGITPEQEVVTKHFCYFGPVPESLYEQIKDDKWRVALQVASRMAEAEVEERPMLRLRVWGQELGETAVDLLSRMTNLDPKARLTIDQVLAHPYWQECVL
jgi:hypothetical protein